MSYDDLWPLVADNQHIARILSEDKLNEPDIGYDWREDQLVGDLDGGIEWMTRYPNGELRPVMTEVCCGDYDGHALARCSRCGEDLEHGQVVAKQTSSAELICSSCTREDRAPRWYVVVYLMNQCFGGNEEGGWWYDAGEIIDFRCCANEENARYHRDRFKEHYDEENATMPSYTSVNSEGEYRVWIQRKKPIEFIPAERPHYE